MEEHTVSFYDDEYQEKEYRERSAPVAFKKTGTMDVMRELFSHFGEPYKG